MTFVSFAQNYEDVILWRALQNVENGCYIDVGANDPIIDSVTKAFYDRGWRGLNIEPVGAWYNKIVLDRPDDINLRIAVGKKKGNLPFYEVVDTGLSTMDEGVAKRHAEEHGFDILQYDVPVVPLTDIVNDYVSGDIHFLKIDVEGSELDVLLGLDLSVFRPWIIIIESTLPLTQLENYQAWESILIENRYHFVYFDGINRYYVADEKNELDGHFDRPPNYFDHFERVAKTRADQRISKLVGELGGVTSQFQDLQSQHHTLLTSKEEGREELLKVVHQLTEAKQMMDSNTNQIIQRIQADKEQEIQLLENNFQSQLKNLERRSDETIQKLSRTINRLKIQTGKYKSRIAHNELLLEEYDVSGKAMLADHVELLQQQVANVSTIAGLQGLLTNASAQQQQFKASLSEAQVQIQAQQARHAAVINSIFWKVTSPLRGIVNVIKKPLRVLANIGLRLVIRYPWLKRVTLATLSVLPPLKARLVNFANSHPDSERQQQTLTHELKSKDAQIWVVQPATKDVNYWRKLLKRGV